jgi:hypothetical protein
MSDKRKSDVNDEPFDAEILSRAKRTVDEYRFAFWREEGWYVGQCVEMETIGVGHTIARCIADARALAITGVASMLEIGKRPPLPMKKKTDNIHVHVQSSTDAHLTLANKEQSSPHPAIVRLRQMRVGSRLKGLKANDLRDDGRP